MRVNYFFKPICFFIIISQLFLSTSCMGKAKNAYNSESDISYSNEFIQYAEDLTEYAEDLTEYAEDLTEYAEDLTEYAEDFTYLYFGEYTNGIYSVQLQSQEYIKAYLEINGVHTIDIEKIIAQLGIGAGTIIITALVLPALPVLAGVTSTANYATRVCIMAIKLSKEAVVGAAFDAAISGTMKYYETNGDIEQTFYSTIEKSSEGFMWGAIISSGMEAVKEVKFVHQAAKEKKAVAEILKCEVKNSNISLDKKSVNQIVKNNTDDLIKILEKVPDDKKELVYRFFASYPDDAAKLYAKYQDDILNIFEKIGKNNEDKLLQILKSQDGDNFINVLNKIQSQNWEKALDILSNTSLNNQKLIYKIFTRYGDDALELYAKYQDDLLLLYKQLGDNIEQQTWLIKYLKQNGDDLIKLLKGIPESELTTAVDYLRFIDDSNSYIATLTDAEKKVLADYKGSAYKTINSNVISDIPDERVALLKKILNEYKNPVNLTAYRGDVGQFGNYRFVSINGELILPKPKTVISNDAFTSTASDIRHTKTFRDVESAMRRHANEFAETRKLQVPVLAEIQIPKGSNALYIDDMARTNMVINKEVLINAGAKFEVVSCEVLKKGTILKDGSVLTNDTVYLILKLLP